MEPLQYDFLNDNFTTFKNVETPKVVMNLPLGDVDISSWADYPTSISGNPIIKPKDESSFIHNNPEYKFSSTGSTGGAADSLNFEELVRQENIPIKITSSYRPNAKTKSGHRSHHSEKDSKGNSRAYDIAPANGYTFENLRQIFYNNPTVVSWFKANGMGILEEMMDGKRGFYDTNGKFHNTGATGPHFHIGPDKEAVKLYDSKIRKGQQGFKVPYFNFENVETPIVNDNFDIPSIDYLESPYPFVTTTKTTSSQDTGFIHNNPEYISSPLRDPSPSNGNNTIKDPLNAVQFFKSKGLTIEQAKGIVGNLYQESGLNTTAVGDRGRSFGLAQWQGSRLQGLINFANKKGTKKEDLETQLEYIWEELNTTEKKALRALKSVSNVEQATTVFMKYYERPGTPKLENRINFAKSL